METSANSRMESKSSGLTLMNQSIERNFVLLLRKKITVFMVLVVIIYIWRQKITRKLEKSCQEVIDKFSMKAKTAKEVVY